MPQIKKQSTNHFILKYFLLSHLLINIFCLCFGCSRGSEGCWFKPSPPAEEAEVREQPVRVRLVGPAEGVKIHCHTRQKAQT